MPGALRLSEMGVRSSLYAENRQDFPGVPDTPLTALLFDPQTGGGLLAAVEGDAGALISALEAEGFEAAVIGRTTETAGQIDIL